MSFEKSIIETIKQRKSIRTFETRGITKEDYEKISKYLQVPEHMVGPFGRKIRFEVVPVKEEKQDTGLKIGTYGFIKNPKAFIVGIVENSKEAMLDFGYVFEKFILYLTEINIGTCWLGGTFTRDTFEKAIEFGEKEVIPCVTPIGYSKEKQRLFDKTVRFVAKADQRKSFGTLFYKGTFQKSLTEKESNSFALPLEMVRLGPSASNKQPWRMVLSEDQKKCHFYLEKTPNYSGNKMRFEMQRIDMGIAMCHFELSCKALNIKGNWKREEPGISPLNKHTEYIVTWEQEG